MDNEEVDVVGPEDVIPGYETDINAVGENRTVDVAAIDDRPWYEFFPAEIYEAVELPDDVVVRP